MKQLHRHPGPNDIYKHDSLEVEDESTRFLPSGDEEDTACGRPTKQPTPLPKAQLGTLFAVRLVDPIAYQQIFPYVNQFLADLHIAEPERVGFYSGLAESAYSLAQVFSMYQMGRLSGYVVGRRPVVFTGLLGIALATTMFGLSTSFTGILASRFLGGFVAANEAVIHSIFAEITDDTNEVLAVSIYFLTWPIGSIIGPFIGGTLANAATRYPHYFTWRIFVEHPYLPPCIASAICVLVGLGVGFMFIEETLPNERKGRQGDTPDSFEMRSRMDPDLDGAKHFSVIELLSIPTVRALALSGFVLSFLIFAFDVVFTLFCYTPVDAGGLALNPAMIGNALSCAGIVAAILRFFVMPYILRRFDYAKTYSACMYIWAVAFGCLPFLNVVARTHSLSLSNSGPSATAPSTFVWAGLLSLLGLSKIAALPHSLSMLLVKRYAPSPSSLGRTNGIVLLAMAVGRSLAPVVVSTLFIEVNGLEWARRQNAGWVWAVAMVAMAFAGARATKGIGSKSRLRRA